MLAVSLKGRDGVGLFPEPLSPSGSCHSLSRFLRGHHTNEPQCGLLLWWAGLTVWNSLGPFCPWSLKPSEGQAKQHPPSSLPGSHSHLDLELLPPLTVRRCRKGMIASFLRSRTEQDQLDSPHSLSLRPYPDSLLVLPPHHKRNVESSTYHTSCVEPKRKMSHVKQANNRKRPREGAKRKMALETFKHCPLRAWFLASMAECGPWWIRNLKDCFHSMKKVALSFCERSWCAKL